MPVAQGGYSDIWCATWRRCATDDRDKKVAVKVLRTHSIVADCEQHERIRRHLNRELSAWKNLRHPNILELYGTCSNFGPHLAMVSPWYPHGSAVKYLKHLGKRATSVVRFDLLCGAATGLEYLHSRSSVHGDLNGNNILVTEDGNACLCDFGLSNIWDAIGPTFVTSTFAGSVRWMAPELIIASVESQRKPVPRSTFTDVYSFGTVIYQLLTGKLPYYSLNNDFQVLSYIYRGGHFSRPEGNALRDDWWNLIEACCSEQQEQRPSMDEVNQRLKEFRKVEQA